MADLLVLEGVEKTYEGVIPTKALSDVTLSLEEGGFVSLIGRSGSGKSTLLNIIGLLDTPSAGRMTLAGKDVTSLGKGQRARMRNATLGFVFQAHYLLPEFTVIENVLMPLLIAGKKADAVIRGKAEKLLGLLGLSGTEGKKADELSGGQKQRVAIGRALINEPRLILADEPTGNLDTANSNQVYELFRTVNKELGTAFLIVTHDRRIAQRTDRIIEIEDGLVLHDERRSVAPVDGGAFAPTADE